MRGNLGLRGGMRGNLVLEAALGLHGVRDGPDIARIDVENLIHVPRGETSAPLSSE